MLRCTASAGAPPQDDGVSVPERHLGLHMPGDDAVPEDLPAALGALVAAHVDLDALLELAGTAELPPADAAGAEDPSGTADTAAAAAAAAADTNAAAAPAAADAAAEARPAAAPPPGGPPVRLAVARDAAFCFYYHDNLALLRAAGAELVPWSPLAEPLPADVAGVYLGGGYPERCAGAGWPGWGYAGGWVAAGQAAAWMACCWCSSCRRRAAAGAVEKQAGSRHSAPTRRPPPARRPPSTQVRRRAVRQPAGAGGPAGAGARGRRGVRRVRRPHVPVPLHPARARRAARAHGCAPRPPPLPLPPPLPPLPPLRLSSAAAVCQQPRRPRLQLTPCTSWWPPAAAGVFPFRTVMGRGKMSMGYVEVETRPGCPLFPPGARVRGQVHHHSEIVQVRARRGGSQGRRAEAAWLLPSWPRPQALPHRHLPAMLTSASAHSLRRRRAWWRGWGPARPPARPGPPATG